MPSERAYLRRKRRSETSGTPHSGHRGMPRRLNHLGMEMITAPRTVGTEWGMAEAAFRLPRAERYCGPWRERRAARRDALHVPPEPPGEVLNSGPALQQLGEVFARGHEGPEIRNDGVELPGAEVGEIDRDPEHHQEHRQQ